MNLHVANATLLKSDGGGDGHRREGSVYFFASEYSNEGVAEAMNESACLCGSVGSFGYFAGKRSSCSKPLPAPSTPTKSCLTKRQIVGVKIKSQSITGHQFGFNHLLYFEFQSAPAEKLQNKNAKSYSCLHLNLWI